MFHNPGGYDCILGGGTLIAIIYFSDYKKAMIRIPINQPVYIMGLDHPRSLLLCVHSHQVQLLQCGSPAEVRAASKTLADFQRSRVLGRKGI